MGPHCQFGSQFGTAPTTGVWAGGCGTNAASPPSACISRVLSYTWLKIAGAEGRGVGPETRCNNRASAMCGGGNSDFISRTHRVHSHRRTALV